MSIATRLKALREERGLSQNDLAQKTGLSKKSIINYENGYRQPNSKAMAILEHFFDVSGAYLRGESDDRNNHDSFDLPYTSFRYVAQGAPQDFDNGFYTRILTHEEDGLLQQYQLLDPAGKEIVQFIIEKELDRLKKLGVVSDDKPDPGNAPTITFTELYRSTINHP